MACHIYRHAYAFNGSSRAIRSMTLTRCCAMILFPPVEKSVLYVSGCGCTPPRVYETGCPTRGHQSVYIRLLLEVTATMA